MTVACPLDRPCAVPAWRPTVQLAPGVAPSDRIDRFLARAGAGFTAAAVAFGPPEELLVGGRHFAVVARDGGLVAASHHTLPRFAWAELFGAAARFRRVAEPAVVAVGTGHANYYHWLLEAVAAAVALDEAGSADALLVPGPLQAWQRAPLAALAPGVRLLEAAADEAVLLDRGRRSGLVGAEPAFAPHPGLLARLAGRAAGLGADGGPLLYLSRRDAGDRRRMANEDELCAALVAIGCDVVEPGGLPFAEQVRRVRGARVVVAPHCAALATLACAAGGAAGPAVVELFAEDYPNRCFAKLAQAKGLAYRAIVNPVVRAGDHHHGTRWAADVALACAAVAEVVAQLPFSAGRG